MFSKKKVSAYRRLDVRLTAWYTFTFLIIVLLTLVFLDYRLAHNLLKGIDHMLEDEAEEIANEAQIFSDSIQDHLRTFEKSVAHRKYYDITFRLLDGRGKPIYTAGPLRGFSCAEIDPDYTHRKNYCIDVKVPGRSSLYRLCTHYRQEDGQLVYVVQVATYLHRTDKIVGNFRTNLSIAFLMSVLFGAVGGWYLARKTLNPVQKIAESTQRITATNLSQRLPLQGTDDELDQLAATINDMLDRLEDSFRKLAQFTADAAHELRTPIAALRGETEVLLAKERSSADYREALGNNLERLDYITRLVNDLLLLSQADEGEKTLNRKSVPLTILVRDIGEAFQAVAQQKGIALSLRASDEVPVSGDDTRLRQLFSNLIDNAIKYTPQGGKITVSLVPDKNTVTVSIRDTGIGIPKKDIPFVFDRFYRVGKSRSRENGGTGLGLSISQWIARAHQGSIAIASQLGRGTTVTVTLPREIT